MPADYFKMNAQVSSKCLRQNHMMNIVREADEPHHQVRSKAAAVNDPRRSSKIGKHVLQVTGRVIDLICLLVHSRHRDNHMINTGQECFFEIIDVSQRQGG